MELTYTNAARKDAGILDITYADFAWGADENNFVIDLAEGCGMPPEDSVVYNEGGDLGGIVLSHSKDEYGKRSIGGLTWSGLYGEHVLCPPAGQMYYSVGPCDACEAVRQLTARLGWSQFFSCEGSCGITVTHTFDGSRDSDQNDAHRYMNGWAALWQLLIEHGLAASFRWDSERRIVSIEVKAAADHTDEESLMVGASQVSYTVKKPVNHLVCLGKGEGAARTVLHLYSDLQGRISHTQTLSGLQEVAEVYDDSSAQDAAELERHGAAKLKSLAAEASMVDVTAGESEFGLCDVVGGTDPDIGLVKATIVKKIVKYEDGERTVEYETSVR